LRGWFDALDYLKREPNVAAGHMAIRQQTTGEQYLEALKGVHIPSREENITLIGGLSPQLASSGRQLMALMLEAKLLPAKVDIEAMLAPGALTSLPP
jgi:NitT/TauT family transport system substrate-binding protein